jgi:hypothetical protein
MSLFATPFVTFIRQKLVTLIADSRWPYEMEVDLKKI